MTKPNSATPSLKRLKTNVAGSVRAYFSELSAIGREATLPYRNFANWNVVKIIVFLYTYLAGLIASLPLLAIAGGVVWWGLTYPAGPNTQAMLQHGNDVISWPTQLWALGENFGKILFLAILALAMLTVFSVFIAYGWYLMSKVSRGYLEGRPPHLKELGFFDFQRLRKYLSVLGLASLPWLAPIGVWGVVCGIAGYLFVGKTDETSVYLLGTSTGLATLATLVWLLALIVRTGFAGYALLADPEGSAPAKSYVAESRRVTEGKVLRVLALFFPFAILVGTVETVLISVDHSLARSRMYAEILQEYAKSGEGKSEVQFVAEYAMDLVEEDAENFGKILQTWRSSGNGIDREFFERSAPYLDRSELDPNWKPYATFFNLLAFLLVDGLFPLVFLSIYLRLGGSPRNTLSAEASEADRADSDRSEK